MSKKLIIARMIDEYGNGMGGGQTVVKELSKQLKKQFNSESILFSQPNPNIVVRLIWDVYVIPQVIWHHFFVKKFDLIHSHGFSAGVAGFIISKIIKIPIIHSVHGSHLMDISAGGLKEMMERFFLTWIPYDLEISDSESFLKYKEVKAKKIISIPNGVYLEKFQILSSKLQKKYKILFVGRLIKQKGADVLIKAIAKVNKKLGDFELRIVGDGPEKESLQSNVNSLQLNSQITFVGKVTGDDYINEMKNADLFVLPSFAEGQPISLLDAWACKMPVIMSNVGNNPFMVQVGKNGWLVKTSNVSDLAKILVRAYQVKDKWREIGQNGYEFIKKECTWDIIAMKFNQQYLNLLNK